MLGTRDHVGLFGEGFVIDTPCEDLAIGRCKETRRVNRIRVGSFTSTMTCVLKTVRFLLVFYRKGGDVLIDLFPLNLVLGLHPGVCHHPQVGFGMGS